jgi:transposase
MYEHFPFPACRVERVSRAGPERVELAVRATQPEACCPTCLTPSNALHSYYRRHPADLPSLGQAVSLNLSVRRFYCRNPACPRQTFAEPLPELLSPRARRTQRLATAQAQVGIALGGEAAARLLQRLAMATSADTVLRLVRSLPLPTLEAPRIVGVDDWALKKGQTYGTILVDLEARRVADLLPDRTALTLATWLQERSSVEVIARDRSSEYARGATLGAPDAVQVADRWHLLDNLRQMFARWLAGLHGRLGQLPPVGDNGLRVQRTGAYPRTRAEEAARAQSRARRVALYEEVRRRVGAGEKLLAISRAMGLARGTVRHYASAPSFPERAARVPLASKLDPYLEYLETRWAAGCENAMALWRELRARGFAGSSQQVRRWMRQRRTAPAKTTPHRWRLALPETAAVHAPVPVPTLPSARQLAWLRVQEPEDLDEAQAASLARIAQDEEVARAVGLGRRLAALIRGCGTGRDQRPAEEPLRTFESWLAEARSCGITALETFAAGLRQEAAAVRAALTLPWSSGQTEGHIAKLKLIKRQMYGRANFDLLRRRILLAA